IPLAIVAGAQPEYAVTLSVPLSFLGVALVYLVVSVNVVFVHWQERLIQKGKLKLATKVPIIACITQFICRFFPIFLACYFGSGYVEALVNMIPETVGNIFLVLGGILPAIGFGLLLKYTYKQKSDIIYMLLGFMMISVFNMPIIAITIVALFLAMRRMGSNDKGKEIENKKETL
ncbi:MAG: PTS sugar transporter subunit IIC, partial [Sporomusa sp.]